MAKVSANNSKIIQYGCTKEEICRSTPRVKCLSLNDSEITFSDILSYESYSNSWSQGTLLAK